MLSADVFLSALPSTGVASAVMLGISVGRAVPVAEVLSSDDGWLPVTLVVVKSVGSVLVSVVLLDVVGWSVELVFSVLGVVWGGFVWV